MFFLISLISVLSAQDAAGAAKQPSVIMQMLPIAVIFVVFYFLLIRPQSKQRKKHAEFLSAIKKGDEVVTSSGIIGTVNHVGDKIVTVEIADNVKVKMLRGMVSASAKDTIADSDKAQSK